MMMRISLRLLFAIAVLAGTSLLPVGSLDSTVAHHTAKPETEKRPAEDSPSFQVSDRLIA